MKITLITLENYINNFSIQIIQHPEWNRNEIQNDVALIKLKNELDFNSKHKHLNPVCLPDKEPLENAMKLNPCIATGWGRTKYRNFISSLLLINIFKTF